MIILLLETIAPEAYELLQADGDMLLLNGFLAVAWLCRVTTINTPLAANVFTPEACR